MPRKRAKEEEEEEEKEAKEEEEGREEGSMLLIILILVLGLIILSLIILGHVILIRGEERLEMVREDMKVLINKATTEIPTHPTSMTKTMGRSSRRMAPSCPCNARSGADAIGEAKAVVDERTGNDDEAKPVQEADAGERCAGPRIMGKWGKQLARNLEMSMPGAMVVTARCHEAPKLASIRAGAFKRAPCRDRGVLGSVPGDQLALVRPAT